MSQITVTAGTPVILQEPIGRSGAKDTMTSVELYTQLASGVMLGMSASEAHYNGFLLAQNTLLHMVLKPYEILWGYNASASGVVYSLAHVNEHARSS